MLDMIDMDGGSSVQSNAIHFIMRLNEKRYRIRKDLVRSLSQNYRKKRAFFANIYLLDFEDENSNRNTCRIPR